METLKNEIVEVERRFAETALKKGVKEAFLRFAADSAVIMRNNRLYKGKEEIRSEGIFHTVWKKQPDGKWKFIWD